MSIEVIGCGKALVSAIALLHMAFMFTLMTSSMFPVGLSVASSWGLVEKLLT